MSTSQTYDSASYASDYTPGKSIFQADNRIFHRSQAHFAYDTVTAIALGTSCGRRLELVCTLSSGKSAHLAIEHYCEQILRMQFAEDAGTTFDTTSEMLVAQPDPVLCNGWTQTPTGWCLALGDRTLHILRDPFNLQVTDTAGKVIFELETDQVAGMFICPPLGIRRQGPNSWPFFSWKIHNSDRFFGLGEKFNKVEKTSTRATIWASDTCGSNTTDMAYKSLPLLSCTAGWGVMLHSGFRSYWEVGTFSYHSGAVLSEDNKLDLFLFLAPTLKGLIGQYTTLTGKPAMPPQWAMGVWMSRCAYGSRQEVMDVAERLRQEKLPCDVVHLDPPWMKTHYYFKIGVDACDFEWNETHFPEHRQMLACLREMGYDICFWINPYLPEGHPVYEEAKRLGYLARSINGGLARLEHGNPVGVIDLTNPDARKWWKGFLHQLVRDGASVFKPDYGDRVAEDALFANGRTGLEMHNLFMFEYTRAPYEVLVEAGRPGLVWRRAGYLGSQRYPGTWAGDTQVSWEAFRCCLHGGLSAGFAAEAFWSHDIGGFCGPKPSPELYIRWAQVGMFSALTRFHGTSPREPWHYGEEALRIVKHHAVLRYSLMPYLLAMAHEATQTGMPLMRHMRLEFENEYNVESLDGQYMLGGDLLVVPIMEAGATEARVYFPGGHQWFPLEQPGAVVDARACGHSETVPAPLDRIPVFVRSGAVLPRFTHHPQHMKQAAPKAMAIELYAGGSSRRLTFEVGHVPVTLDYQADDAGNATLQMSPMPLVVEVRLIGFSATTLVSSGRPLSTTGARGPVTIDATSGVDLRISAR